MTQVILHGGEAYIAEDLDFYFSTERDKNNQIRPDKSLVSMLPVTVSVIDGQQANFFYPQLPYQFERIYLGISISLFSNHWGASFLIELLKLVKPGGAIILPVYPEAQAEEKGYWSRSFLENTFLSRSRWIGISNVNAENDGVMSLRVGKKWPTPHPSSIQWFYQERCHLLLSVVESQCANDQIKAQVLETFAILSKLIWQAYQSSAILERIIKDNFLTRKPISLAYIGDDYGMLINDLMLSPQVNVEHGVSHHVGSAIPSLLENISAYFDPITKARHQVYHCDEKAINLVDAYDVIIVREMLLQMGAATYESLLKTAWSHLNTNGLLILLDDFSSDPQLIKPFESLLNGFGEICYYSNIVASKIELDVVISHYSLSIEEELRQEARNKTRVYRVLKKHQSGTIHIK